MVEEKVDDGGGCVEVWNTMNDVREESPDDPDRRAVIKLVGTGAASVTGIGAVGGQAGAKAVTDDTDWTFDPTPVTGPEARRTVAKALRSDELKVLRQELRKSENAVPNPSDPHVIEFEDEEGTTYRTVSLPLQKAGRQRTEEQVSAQDVAVTIQGDKVVLAKSVISTYEEVDDSRDDLRVSATTYEVDDDGTRTREGTAFVEMDPKIASENEFGTQSTECFACTTVGDIVCTLGCGYGVTIGCSGTTVANLAGGATCFVIAGTLCTILQAGSNEYVGANCGADIGIEFACHYAGYCDEP